MSAGGPVVLVVEDEPPRPRMLVTETGVGYRLREPTTS